MRSRQPRADRTRSHIIETAALAFAERGFDGVSLNDLVRTSEVSKGAFYFHFPSKEELALACFRTKQEELLARLLADELPAAAADRVAHLLRRRARLVREDPSLGCVTRLGSELNVRSAPGSTYASFQDLALTLIADLIRDGQRAGEFRAGLDPDGAARTIFAAIVGTDVLSLLFSEGSDLPSRSEELTDLVLHGLLTPRRV
jgi:AcrR family transcriptional regulator